MIKKINKRLNLSPRRVRDFYNNIISGVITGGIIGGFLSIIQTSSQIVYTKPTVLQISIFILMFVFLYSFGKNSISKIMKDKNELMIYKSNIKSGFFASSFVVLLLIFQDVKIRLLIIIPLTLLFILLIWLISGRKKK